MFAAGLLDYGNNEKLVSKFKYLHGCLILSMSKNITRKLLLPQN